MSPRIFLELMIGVAIALFVNQSLAVGQARDDTTMISAGRLEVSPDAFQLLLSAKQKPKEKLTMKNTGGDALKWSLSVESPRRLLVRFKEVPGIENFFVNFQKEGFYRSFLLSHVEYYENAQQGEDGGAREEPNLMQGELESYNSIQILLHEDPHLGLSPEMKLGKELLGSAIQEVNKLPSIRATDTDLMEAFEDFGDAEIHFGYSNMDEFKLVEVSTDEGDSWTTIYPVRGFPYLLDATCLVPIPGDELRFSNGDGIFVTGFSAPELDFESQNLAGAVDWLSMSPNSGTLEAGNLTEVELNFDLASLKSRNTKGYIKLVSNDSNNPQIMIPVHLTADTDPEGDRSHTESIAVEIPDHFSLRQNYPNPFNPTTTIKYDIPTQTDVTLKVFDILGRQVATLLNEVEEPGYKSVEFDGSLLASGLYFYRLEAWTYVQTRKLLLLK